MKKFLAVAWVVVMVLMVTSCSTTVLTRSVFQSYQPSANIKRDTFDAISASLVNNGFEISLANERLGLVNTAYRNVFSGGDMAANVIGAFASALSKTHYTSYSRTLALSFQVTDTGYRVVPKVSRSAKTASVYKTDTTSEVEYPTQSSDEGKLVMKIISEINRTLGLADHVVWEEKEVSVN